MKHQSALALALSVALVHPTTSGASESNLDRPVIYSDVRTQPKVDDNSTSRSYVKVLSDHPGPATALTSRQKSEIREILNKGKTNKSFICTGASLSGQRESMYRVVLHRARLVCDYAKSLDPSIRTIVKEKRTLAAKFNGRVVVVSK